MAETALKLGLKSIPYVTENYEKAWDPVRDKTMQGVKQIKKKVQDRGDYSDYSDDDGGPRSRRYSNGRRNGSRARSSGRGDVVEERMVYRTTNGRARSLGRDRDYRRGRYSSSESSISPPRRNRSKRRQSLGEKAMAALGLGAAASSGGRRRSYSSSRSRSRNRSRPRRRSRSVDYGRERGAVGAYRGGGGYQDARTPNRYKPAAYNTGQERGGNQNGSNGQDRGRSDNQQMVKGGGSTVAAGTKRSSSQSDSSSDVCSSSEDERRQKKMKGKEWLTAGLAAVATVHAAHGVYSSMEARDKRMLEVAKGEMSPEEAKKKRNKARLQDAAAISIAVLGVKGAYSEWQEVQESRHELDELKKERAERHEKRMKKQEKYGYYPSSRNRNSSRGRNDSRDDYRDYRNHSR